MVLLGFGAGLPYLLVFGTLSFRLREAGVSLPTIGFLSWVALAYPFKWTWAPFVDRIAIPGLTARMGRRRSWLLVAQAAVAGGLFLMGRFDPQENLAALTACAIFTAVASATQDIALDAYRIETAPVPRQAAMAAAYQTGYRVAMICASAGALWIAARAAGGVDGYSPAAWGMAYSVMAALALVGPLTVAWAPEARAGAALADGAPVRSDARAGLLAPFADFFRRFGWYAVLILALVSTYRMANILMGVMANPFYHDIGFTKEQVAAVTKVYGLVMTLLGGMVGGALTLRVGIARMMWGAAAASSASILLYALLATRGPDLVLLMVAVSTDNFAEGISGTVFIAFLSGLTRQGYTATQYAFLSSATLLVPKFLAGFSGLAVNAVGYPVFFGACAASGLIALCLVWLTQRYVPPQRFSNR